MSECFKQSFVPVLTIFFFHGKVGICVELPKGIPVFTFCPRSPTPVNPAHHARVYFWILGSRFMLQMCSLYTLHHQHHQTCWKILQCLIAHRLKTSSLRLPERRHVGSHFVTKLMVEWRRSPKLAWDKMKLEQCSFTIIGCKCPAFS